MPEILPTSDLALTKRRKRLIFRAWHRGVKEADILIGTFVDIHVNNWDESQLEWFETLLEEPDRDILAWVMQSEPVPGKFQTTIMHAMQKLDYIDLKR